MSSKLLPHRTYLLQVFGGPDGRGRSTFAAWRREPIQGGVIACSIFVTDLDAFVADRRARGWRVRISSSRRFREVKPHKQAERS